MSVKTQHPEYAKYSGKWKRVRDVVEGEDAIHAAGTAYLPKLKDQDQKSYDAMVKRTPFVNYSWRTMDGLHGMMFRKEPTVEVAEGAKSLLEDATMCGVPFSVFAQEIALEVLTVGRVGVLVDHPPASTAGRNVAEAESNGFRPYMTMYFAENILNWKYRRVRNRWVLAMVVLKEKADIGTNKFEHKTEDRYRVLELDEAGFYCYSVYKIDERGEDQLIEGPIYPVRNGAVFDVIPFKFFNRTTTQANCEDPPLIDLVNLNLKHYRVSADHEHGCHFTGLPTAWISGYQPAQDDDGKVTEKLYIGGEAAWVFPHPEAKADYLEFTGQGLGALEKNLDRKEKQMALIGARMLMDEQKGAQTFGEAQIKRTGENSILATIAQTISIGLTEVLKWFCEWGNFAGDVNCELNRDFLPVPMDAPTLTALMAAWQGGAISYNTLFDLLQRADVIDAEVTQEDEEGRISETPPPAPAAPEPTPKAE